MKQISVVIAILLICLLTISSCVPPNKRAFEDGSYCATISTNSAMDKSGDEIAKKLLRKYLRGEYFLYSLIEIDCRDIECKTFSAVWSVSGERKYAGFNYEKRTDYYGLKGPWSEY